MQGYLSINTKNPPTVDFGNLIVNAYIDVRHLDVTRLNTFKSPPIHQLERLGFAQPGRPPLRPCTIKYMETLIWVQLVGKLGNKSGAQPWVCRTAHGMPCRPAVLSWRVIETNRSRKLRKERRRAQRAGVPELDVGGGCCLVPRHTICMELHFLRKAFFRSSFLYS